MLTNNWYTIMKRKLGVPWAQLQTPVCTKGTEAQSVVTFEYLYFTSGLHYTSDRNSYGVSFGDGDAIPSADDYILSGSFIKNLGVSHTEASTMIDGNTVKKTIIYTITNNNSTDITIKEIGYKGYVSSSEAFLLDRTLLEEPVTIPAGGVGQVTYTIEFNIADI